MFRRLDGDGGLTVRVFIDGREVQAAPGDTVAGVLLRQADIHARLHPLSGTPRAPFCLMGVCFDCLAVVDGASSVQTCLLPVREGMRIERQPGKAKL